MVAAAVFFIVVVVNVAEAVVVVIVIVVVVVNVAVVNFVVLSNLLVSLHRTLLLTVANILNKLPHQGMGANAAAAQTD